MKTRFLPLLLAGLAFAGCTGERHSQNLETLLRNPLFAERYADEIVESLVTIKLQQDPILKQAGKEAAIDTLRESWHKKAGEAKTLQRQGRSGVFLPMKEYAKGEVVFTDSSLYFGPEFEMTPGPALHVYFTTVVDPRDVQFPDDTALDLGLIESPYGAQQYTVPELQNPLLYRTVVLWDTALQRLYGFAQISEKLQ